MSVLLKIAVYLAFGNVSWGNERSFDEVMVKLRILVSSSLRHHGEYKVPSS
jgi:hypothetical protein